MRALLSFFLAVGLASCVLAAEITGPQPTLPQTPLTLQTVNGPVQFTVEMATSWPQQERGLMFRKSLAPNAGMLFDFVKESNQNFWMKNTLIPLDMLFIAADGTIKHIHANAVPKSEETIPSGGHAVRCVLEINGGSAKLLGIKPGDKVKHKIFGNA